MIKINQNRKQDADPLFKIRTLLDIVKNNCVKIQNETPQSIDEMAMPYKNKNARSKKIYYFQTKKNRFKVDDSGIVEKLMLYVEDGTFCSR